MPVVLSAFLKINKYVATTQVNHQPLLIVGGFCCRKAYVVSIQYVYDY